MSDTEFGSPSNAIKSVANYAIDTRARGQFIQKILPFIVFGLAILTWELIVRINQIPHYILPAPSLVAKTLWDNLGSLMVSWWFTMKITFGALFLAVVGGVALAMLFALNKWVELSLFPFAIVLQVTPIVAIAPLILIFIDSTAAALLLCAWIVAFFPILSNTLIGLRSADHNLRDLFTLYRASPWQTLRHLLIPSAMPYFIAGLKVAGGLSLIGAVVAEFTAGAAGKETGLASRILEASFRTEIPKMFAALVLVSLTGIMIYLVFNAISKLVLGSWHESEIKSSR
jgi:NitT/TauT family transport system permease protein